jgi:hypothetical protein
MLEKLVEFGSLVEHRFGAEFQALAAHLIGSRIGEYDDPAGLRIASSACQDAEAGSLFQIDVEYHHVSFVAVVAQPRDCFSLGFRECHHNEVSELLQRRDKVSADFGVVFNEERRPHVLFNPFQRRVLGGRAYSAGAKPRSAWSDAYAVHQSRSAIGRPGPTLRSSANARALRGSRRTLA